MPEHSVLGFKVKHLPDECFGADCMEQRCPAVSPESELDLVFRLFQEGAEEIAVYDCLQDRREFRGVIHWRKLMKFMETGVLAAEARLHSLLHSSYDAVCMVDEQEIVLFWNSQAEYLYGIKKVDILGKDIRLFFENLVVTGVLKSKAPVLGSYHQPRLGTYVLINAYPVILRGRVIGSVSVERDITGMVMLNRELIRANRRADITEDKELKAGLGGDPFSEIYGRSENFREVLETARKVAATDAVVLLQGESGTGKEVLARALHRGGHRREKPFIPINCSAIPYHLFESELFGYEGGAFTGAEKKGKPGKFALAHGGTLFLDEVSELNPDLQVKLLRVLQDKVYYPVGGSKPCCVDVRIIAATNRDLTQLAGEGRFRKDLYYRLNVVNIRIPPLRERKKDIPELAYLFLAEFSAAYRKKVLDIDPAVMAFFLRYHWPGNIRELRNVIERMVILTEQERLTGETLPHEMRPPGATIRGAAAPGGPLAEAKGNLERELIVNALAVCGGNKSKAAQKLGLPRSSLYYRIRKLDIAEQDYNL